MFGIGLPEMILILALALIVVGPDKLPELARSIAKGVLELKKTVTSLKEEFAEDNPFDTVRPELEDAADKIKKQLGDATPDGFTGLVNDIESGFKQALDDDPAAPAADSATDPDENPDTAAAEPESADGRTPNLDVFADTEKDPDISPDTAAAEPESSDGRTPNLDVSADTEKDPDISPDTATAEPKSADGGAPGGSSSADPAADPGESRSTAAAEPKSAGGDASSTGSAAGLEDNEPAATATEYEQGSAAATKADDSAGALSRTATSAGEKTDDQPDSDKRERRSAGAGEKPDKPPADPSSASPAS